MRASPIRAWCRSLSCDIDIDYCTAVHHLCLRGTYCNCWCSPPCLTVNMHLMKGNEIIRIPFCNICSAKMNCPQFPRCGLYRNHRTGTKVLFLARSAVRARPDPLYSPAFCFTDVTVLATYAWDELMPHDLLHLVAHGLDYTWNMKRERLSSYTVCTYVKWRGIRPRTVATYLHQKECPPLIYRFESCSPLEIGSKISVVTDLCSS